MTRRRLLLLALIVILLGLLGVAGFRGVGKDDEARGKGESTSPTTRASETREEAVGRRKETGSAAEARLKSLLAVREGEVGFIRVPGEVMGRLLGFDGPIGFGGDKPDLFGTLERSRVWTKLTGHTDGIEGSMDPNGDDFEWSGSGMHVRGTLVRHGGTRVLKMTFTEGDNTLECETTVSPGSVAFLHTGNPDPEGLLIVIGADGPVEESTAE